MQHRSQVEEFSLMLPFHNSNDGYPSQVCLWGKATRFHNRFQDSGGPFKNDLPGMLNRTRHHHREGPAFNGYQDFVILKLRLIESRQFTLQLPGCLSRRMNLADQGQAEGSVSANLL